MFVPSKEPIPLSEACLLGLCPSLNAPVVRHDELPSGPARAAIVTFAEEYGDLGLAVAIRALESGRVVVFRCRETLVERADVDRAMEVALRFAEGLGFLFDDDMIEGDTGAGRSEALEHWNRLTGEGEVFQAGGVAPPPAPPVSEITLPGEGLDGPMEDLLGPDEPLTADESPAEAGAGAEGADPVLLLDDLMEFVEEAPGDELVLDAEPVSQADLEVDVVGTPTGVGAAAREAPTVVAAPAEGAVPLSKFRRGGRAAGRSTATPAEPAKPAKPAPPARRAAAGRPARPVAEPTEPDLGAAPAEDGTDDAQRPAALGRIPIVRRRLEPEGGRASLLARILASF